MPEASLISDSPLRSALHRGLMSASFDAADTAMGSVGPSAAPNANAAASEMEGIMAFTKKPTATMIARTKPIASDKMERLLRHNSVFFASFASWNSSGAMNRTKNSSDSSNSRSICRPATTAMARPRPIWISGDDTLGTSWSITDEARTAASISNISRNVSIWASPSIQRE